MRGDLSRTTHRYLGPLSTLEERSLSASRYAGVWEYCVRGSCVERRIGGSHGRQRNADRKESLYGETFGGPAESCVAQKRRVWPVGAENAQDNRLTVQPLIYLEGLQASRFVPLSDGSLVLARTETA